MSEKSEPVEADPLDGLEVEFQLTTPFPKID